MRGCGYRRRRVGSSHGSGRGFYAGPSEQIAPVSSRRRWRRRSFKSARQWPAGSRWPSFRAGTTSSEDSCLWCRWPSARSSRTSFCAGGQSRVEPLRQPSAWSLRSSFCSTLVDLYFLGLSWSWLWMAAGKFGGFPWDLGEISITCMSELPGDYEGTMKGWNHGLHQTTTARGRPVFKGGGRCHG